MNSARVVRATGTYLIVGLVSLPLIACGSTDKASNSTGVGGTAANGSAPTGVSSNAGAGAATSTAAGLAGTAALASADVPKEHIGDHVFDETQLQSYYLNFSDAEYAKLMDFSTLLNHPWEVNENRYVMASVKLGDTELPSVGVRFKGNYSITGCIDFTTKKRIQRIEPFYGNVDVCQRFSLKLDFNRYDSSCRLDGLKKLNLHAMAADPSKFRERLGYSLFRDMDILAPRAVHARLFINGEYQSVFGVVEEIDGRFTANRFPAAGDGNLYRDLWPSTSDASTTTVKSALRTNDDPAVADVSDFLAFKAAVASSTEADFATKVAPYVDFDYLARCIVVDRGINNFDGVMAFS